MDTLLVTYAALVILVLWGVLLIRRVKRLWLAWLAGVIVFCVIAWLALGTGFFIRIPQLHRKMVVLVWTVHGERVHALARPLDAPEATPVHIVFSIDPSSRRGARMRAQFFAAVRKREGLRRRVPIVIDMWGYGVDAGVHKYDVPQSLPPKMQNNLRR